MMRNADDIPTALSDAETRALQEFTWGLRVVECGALLGFSTLKIADVAASVVSIDRHEGYGPSTLRAFMSNIEGRSNIVPVQADCIKLLPFMTADRYFIDLDGTYETSMAVLNAVRHGHLAIHDYNRQRCEGVAKAIQDAGWHIDYTVDSLAFLNRR